VLAEVGVLYSTNHFDPLFANIFFCFFVCEHGAPRQLACSILHIAGLHASEPAVLKGVPLSLRTVFSERSLPLLSTSAIRNPSSDITNLYTFGVHHNAVVFCVAALIGAAPWSNGTSFSCMLSIALVPMLVSNIVVCHYFFLIANSECRPLLTGCSMMTSAFDLCATLTRVKKAIQNLIAS
jgi:hypothetical protein